MKYTRKERLDIGRRIYDGEITRSQAAEKYGIGSYTARDYMRMYRDLNKLPPMRSRKNSYDTFSRVIKSMDSEKLETMTKDELIRILLSFKADLFR